MPYNKVATRDTPALVIYLLDCSASMREPLDGAPKIDHVNESIRKVLVRMVQRSTRGEVVSPRYRLAMIAYSNEPTDILGGIMTIDEIIQKGTPTLSTVATTDTAAAFQYARDLLNQEISSNSDLPAPMVCHLTDGMYNGADPAPIAQEIMQMSNGDGNVLVANIYVGPNLTKAPIFDVEAWPGISDLDELGDPYAQQLFEISSPLPESYANVIKEEGYSLKPGCRMIIPGTNKELIELAFAMSGATPTSLPAR